MVRDQSWGDALGLVLGLGLLSLGLLCRGLLWLDKRRLLAEAGPQAVWDRA